MSASLNVFPCKAPKESRDFIQKRALRFLYDDCNSPLEEILKKSGKVCMEINRLRYLWIKIYKSINNINPSFMKQIFQLREKYMMKRHPLRQSPCGGARFVSRWLLMILDDDIYWYYWWCLMLCYWRVFWKHLFHLLVEMILGFQSTLFSWWYQGERSYLYRWSWSLPETFDCGLWS